VEHVKTWSAHVTYRSIAFAGLALVVTTAGSAHAAARFSTDLGPGEELVDLSDRRVEARFKADTTNWDTRLAFDSFPNNGDTTANVNNGRSSFESRTFSFDLRFTQSSGLLEWIITRPNGTMSTIDVTPTGFDQPNTFELFTNGERVGVDVEGLTFEGLGMTITNFPDIDTRPVVEGGPVFAESFLFLGDDVDLFNDGDWSFRGALTFGTFAPGVSNPNERGKITIKVREAEIIPAPAAGMLLGVAGVAGLRRRR